MEPSTSFVDSSRLGVIVLCSFAAVWVFAAVGLSSIRPGVTIGAALAVLVGAGAVVVASARRTYAPLDEAASPLDPARRRTVFIAANVVQAVLFSVLISVCIAIDALPFIALGGSLIVGAHLIPLGLSFAERTFVLGGVLLMITGTVGLAATATQLVTANLATGGVCLANAVTLVGLAALQVRRHGRHRTNGPAPRPAPDA